MSHEKAFRPDIQGLRGLAVLLVIIYHFGIPGLSGGYVGVDVFFVISGYLITGLLLREIERSDTVDFANFYARRVRRLLPAASIVLLATMAVAWMVYSPLELKIFTSSALATAVYLSNFWFGHLSTDYLAEGTDANPLLHTWSLGVEEQFYLFWPLLLVAAVRWLPNIRRRRKLTLTMTVIGVVSFLSCLLLTQYSQPWAFFSSPTRAWEFAVGALVALWIPRGPLAQPPLVRSAGLLGLAMIMLAASLFDNHTVFPGYAALLPVLGAALVIAAGHVTPSVGAGRILAWAALRRVGDISYSLYLWHWPVFLFLAFAVEQVGMEERLIALSITFILALLTYYLIENPIRFNHALLRRAGASIALGLALSLVSVVVSLVLRDLSAAGIELEAQQRYIAARNDLPRIYANGCHASVFAVETPECVFGDPESATVVVLFGDSHAAQWFPALEKIAARERWRLISLTKSSCPSIPYPIELQQFGRAYSECDDWRDAAMERIGVLQPTLTILGNSSTYVSGSEAVSNRASRDPWVAATREMLIELAASSAASVVLRDTPWLPFNAPKCLSRADWQGDDPSLSCRFELHSETAEAAMEIESAALSTTDRSYRVDMTDLICPEEPCLVERERLVLFKDSNHLTAKFVEHIADRLHERLEPILDRAEETKRPGS